MLVVDDDSDLVEMLAEILRSEGYETRLAQSGHRALELIAERTPDVVLLDIEMPGLSGPDTAYMMFLRDCGAEEIPVALSSGIVNLPRVAAAVGTPYFLAKPYDSDALLKLVERALQEGIPPRPQGRT